MSCVDIDPQKTLSKMSELKIPMTEFRKMANAVVGDNGELLKYCHLIANKKNKGEMAALVRK